MAAIPSAPQAAAPSAAGAFQQQRQRLTQRFTQQGQEQDDAMKRKLAQMGNLNSGAAVKLQQQGQDQIVQQREEAIGNLDSQQAQQQMQLDEAQRMRDFQGGQFDRNLALQRDAFDVDKVTKLGGLDIAKNEMELKRMEQEFNQAVAGIGHGYGLDLTQYLPTNARDSAGRLVNPNGKGLGYEEQRGIYTPGGMTPENTSDEAVKRRMQQEAMRRAGLIDANGNPIMPNIAPPGRR